MLFIRVCLALGLLTANIGASAIALFTERVNVNPATGAQADGISDAPVLSADGCIVAFVSQSGTLAPASYGLTKTSPSQIYAVDRCVTPHTIELVSVTADGLAAADQSASTPNISADGRYVSFMSAATNLPVAGSGHSGDAPFLFVRDRTSQTTFSPLQAWRPTANNNGGIGFDSTANIRYMSADASRFVFDFRSPPAVQQNLYVVNYAGGVSTLQPICATFDINCLTGTSDNLTISADGSSVLLQSTYAFAAGGSIGGFYSVYAYDVGSAVSTLVSVNANGTPANQSVQPLTDIALSGDGKFAAFNAATATNFPGNTGNTLMLKNRISGDLILVSAASNGTPVTISYGIALPQLSDDGNRVVFTAENAIVPHLQQAGYDAVAIDFARGRVVSVCISSSGSFASAGCSRATISGDGKWAAFRSIANTLVQNDTNEEPDIFVVSVDPVLDDLYADGFER